MNAPVRNAHARLVPGDPAPWFSVRCGGLPSFAFDTMAGRYLVFCFFLSAADAKAQAAIGAVRRHRRLFDDTRASFFGISIDREDEAQPRVRDTLPGIRIMWDFEGRVSRLYGALPQQPSESIERDQWRRAWVIVDPTLHVLAVFRFADIDKDHDAVFKFLQALPPPDRFAGFEIPAPVLILPNVLSPEFCRRLIDLYEEKGGFESGVVRGNSNVLDNAFKRRKDLTIKDPNLIRMLQARVMRCVAPEILRLFFMEITRMERYIVGCYSAEDGGHFRPHRDNGGGITAHRRFAVSVNLNGEFEGGEVCFPEYNARGHKAPAGWAVIFPCNILHKVTQVTSGRRYAFLPFVYDESGAKIREAFAKESTGKKPEITAIEDAPLSLMSK